MKSSPLRVLVIDDDTGLSEAILNALSDRGLFACALRPAATSSPTAVAAAAASFRPDVVLLDIVMPVNVSKLAKELRAHPDLKGSAILGCSGHSALADGIVEKLDGFLHKPFDTSELINAVTEAACLPPRKDKPKTRARARARN
jgi:DNA-binding NarL/FixJ family response regulator